MEYCDVMAVLIPAQNEELLLPRCLESVLRSRAFLMNEARCVVVVASDDSTDRTAEVAEAMLGDGDRVLRICEGNVGRARAHAADWALEHLRESPRQRCWLANTDADCEVPETWLHDHLLAARQRITAVAGVIDVDSFEEHLPHVQRRFRETYLLHADGTHPHVHGANLGVRADAYLRAGGWGAQKSAEDHDLWRRLGESGAVRRSDAGLRVMTSGRRQGRAPNGFAEALAAHNAMPEVTL